MPSSRPVAPTLALCGLLMATLLVASYAWLFTRHAASLHDQADAARRSQLDAVQLLRIQTDLNKIGDVMRDVAADTARPVTTSASQFDYIRRDLTDAMTQHAALATASDEQEVLTSTVARFWTGIDRMLALSRDGHEEEARTELKLSLQRQHVGLLTTSAYLLLENNELQRVTSQQTPLAIAALQRQTVWLLGGALLSLVVALVAMVRSRATGKVTGPAA